MKKIILGIFLLFLTTFAPVGASGDQGTIVGPDLIQKEQMQILTISEILQLYSSESTVFIVEDQYTGNGANIGIHNIKLSSIIDNENYYKDIQIEVLKSIGPIKAVGNKRDIHVSKNIKLTSDQIARIHENTGLINLNSTSQIMILQDTYTSNSSTPGIYSFEYRLLDATGLDRVISNQIFVYEAQNITGDLKPITQPSNNNPLENQFKSILTMSFLALVLMLSFIVYRRFKK